MIQFILYTLSRLQVLATKSSQKTKKPTKKHQHIQKNNIFEKKQIKKKRNHNRLQDVNNQKNNTP